MYAINFFNKEGHLVATTSYIFDTYEEAKQHADFHIEYYVFSDYIIIEK